MRILLAAVVVGLVVLILTSKSQPDPAPVPTKAEQQADAYRQCVGTDHSRAAQDRCQRHVWGQTFGEDDHRWLCDRMGNWLCALRPDPKL